MSLVERAPLTNYRKQARKGVVRYIDRTGAPVSFTPERRPVGTPDASADVKRAYKEVVNSDRQSFKAGKGIRRGSPYNVNTSGNSGTGWDGTRSRTK